MANVYKDKLLMQTLQGIQQCKMKITLSLIYIRWINFNTNFLQLIEMFEQTDIDKLYIYILCYYADAILRILPGPVSRGYVAPTA